MSDIFREVDEDLRHEQYKKLWDRFGPYVIGAAVLIVAATAGFRGWEYWQGQRAAASGDRFIESIEASQAGNHEQAIDILEDLAAGSSGDYPVLAGFRLAAERAATGDLSGAVEEYDAIAGRSGVPDEVRNFARIRAAFIEVDNASADALRDRIGDLADTGNPWRHTARELIGLAAWRDGDNDTARAQFEAIVNDAETPGDLRQRAEVLLDLITARAGAAPAAG